MNIAPYLARRAALLKQIGDGTAIIPTAPEQIRNRGSNHPYCPDSDFWYLSGFSEPEAVIVLVGGDAPRAILFCREKDEERETWEGFRYGPDLARETFGFDEAHAFSTLERRLPELLRGRPAAWLPFSSSNGWKKRLFAALDALRAKSGAGIRVPCEIRDLRVPLDVARLIKDAGELALMQKAAEIASAGHARAMRACVPGTTEYALEAEIGCEFRRLGANAHAYPPIVAGGENACVLHYTDNNALLADGALVLIDAGSEFNYYAADITRTFPVNGRFGPAQRDVYQIVLAAQDAAFSAIRPGAPFSAFHDAALRVLVQGLIDLKVLKGSPGGLIESQAYQPWYRHRTGHWLGLDVHDVGKNLAGQEPALAPGMTLTVEPGLYFRRAPDIPAELQGIGIRIEDNVRVTENGAQIYTSAPKSVAEIEAIMAEA